MSEVLEREIDLSKIPEEYDGQWVALDNQNNVIAHSDSYAAATKEAEAKVSNEFLMTVAGAFRDCYLL